MRDTKGANMLGLGKYLSHTCQLKCAPHSVALISQVLVLLIMFDMICRSYRKYHVASAQLHAASWNFSLHLPNVQATHRPLVEWPMAYIKSIQTDVGEFLGALL
jgi:MFS superfamily sulfate permease-like transporter